jgi:hypothetical protein
MPANAPAQSSALIVIAVVLAFLGGWMIALAGNHQVGVERVIPLSRAWVSGRAARLLALIMAAVILGAACGAQQHAVTKPKSTPSASPTADSQSQLAAWQACGSDVVPPADVLAMPKLPVKVDASKTNGAVSQAEADKWAGAWLREQNIEDWAGTSNRDAILRGGCLGSQTAYDNLFAGEVASMREAQTAGGHIRLDPPATLVGISLVPAPAKAASYVGTLSGLTPAYALVVTFRGPLASYVVDSSGNRIKKLGETPAGIMYAQAVFGEYRAGPAGPVWYQLAAGDCQSAWMAGTCVR